MKKSLMRIFAVIMLVGIFAVQGVFAADTLTVESIFPEDGDKGMQTTNQMARIVFSGNINIDDNEKCFKIVDSKGKAQPIMVLEQPDVENRVNLVLKNNLAESEEYTIIIDKSLTDTNGNKLGEDYKASFKTKSAKTESLVTTAMMFVMFGAIIFLTIRDTTKQAKEQAAEQNKNNKKKPEKNNPYKDPKKEAEKIYAQRKKAKQQKVQAKMRENEQKRNAKKRK